FKAPYDNKLLVLPLRREPGRRRAAVARRVPERDRPASPGGHEHQGVHRVEREREKLADGEVPGRDGRRRPRRAAAVPELDRRVRRRRREEPGGRFGKADGGRGRPVRPKRPERRGGRADVERDDAAGLVARHERRRDERVPRDLLDAASRGERRARRRASRVAHREAAVVAARGEAGGLGRVPRDARHAVAVVRPRHRTRACVQIPELDGAVRGAGGEDRRRVASPRDGQHGVAVRARRRPRRLPPGGRGRVAAQARDGRRGLHDVQIPHVDARLHRPDRDAGARRAVLQERERQRERLQSNVVVHVEAPLLVVVHVHFYAREVVLGAARQEHGVRRADRVVLRVAVRGAPLRGPRLRRAGPAGDGADRANHLSCSQSQV
ncbi:unnamed protein product, partial [Pelagomonas calceolata]